MRFTVTRQNGVTLPPLDVTLNLPGEHNVQNALAAIAVATELNVDDAAICEALAHFTGVGRRFQRLGDVSIVREGDVNRTGSNVASTRSFTLIDDYGHHPVEMAATLAAARGAFPGRRIVLAFQPHRYTRTRDLFDDFVAVLASADVLLVLDIYAAGEKPIPGADARALCRAIRARGQIDPIFVNGPGTLLDVLGDVAQAHDLVMLLGAGSIGRVAEAMTFAESPAC